LEPGALLHVPYDYDLTGMSIVANGRTFAVSRVVYESIAWNAGIRSGDVIREIDGRPASAMNLQELRSAFRHDGRQVSLSIYNARTPQTVKMSMPDLK
jgi:C-terminal processing protease CtpA/Prc